MPQLELECSSTMKVIAFVSATVCTLALSLHAQQPSELQAVERAMVSYAGAHLATTEVIVFDGVPTSAKQATRPPAHVASLASALHAQRIGRTDDFYKCASSKPSTCSISGADAIISLSEPTIQGDTALITVRVLRATRSQRAPVARSEDRYRLVRHGDGSWTVDGWVAGSIT